MQIYRNSADVGGQAEAFQKPVVAFLADVEGMDLAVLIGKISPFFLYV